MANEMTASIQIKANASQSIAEVSKLSKALDVMRLAAASIGGIGFSAGSVIDLVDS